jgi:hypothetical protein
VQKLTVASQQGDMFSNKKMFSEQSADICVEFLKGQGYSVRPPMGYPVEITKLDDLITVFYGHLRNIYEPHLLPYSNDKRDRAVAKSFVEGRMETDMVSRHAALQQCALIIETIFKHPEIFKFETPPTFGILGQKGMGWVTDRAVQLINKAITKDQEISLMKAVDNMTKKIEENCQMGYSLDELVAIQKKLEEQDGKKEIKT